MTKAQIKFSKDYQKVPIATIDGEVLPGSDLIIERVSQRFGGNAVQSLAAADSDKWMAWSGERLAILLYPNITRNFQESWECFEYAEQVDSWSALTRTAVRVAGPVGMLFANGKIKKKYNIVDERKELMDALLEVSAFACDTR